MTQASRAGDRRGHIASAAVFHLNFDLGSVHQDRVFATGGPAGVIADRIGFGAYTTKMLLGGIDNNASYLSLPFNGDTTYQLVVPTIIARAPKLYLRILSSSSQYSGQICEVYTTANTTNAADGTLKAASPVIQIFHEGSALTNAESKGCTVKRTGTGEYLVEGCMALNSDAAWGGIDGGFDIPKDRNGQALVWLDYEMNANGSILVKIFHRTYPDAPAFASNEKNGFSNGDPIDIPEDQYVSVRVEMPEDSILNLKVRTSEESETIMQQDNSNSFELYMKNASLVPVYGYALSGTKVRRNAKITSLNSL